MARADPWHSLLRGGAPPVSRAGQNSHGLSRKPGRVSHTADTAGRAPAPAPTPGGHLVRRLELDNGSDLVLLAATAYTDDDDQATEHVIATGAHVEHYTPV